jgi:hypothetical protein
MPPRKFALSSPGPITNGLVCGRLAAVEPGHILVEGPLGGNIRIIAPVDLLAAVPPLGCSLQVYVRRVGGTFTATSIRREEDGQIG